MQTYKKLITGKLHNSTCNIAQDIVYLASGSRKLTPKHIGLGLTPYQSTKSEKLVDLFHAAGHTIGMDTIRRIDTTIATDILDRYEKNGNIYLPHELAPYSPGRVILASCDNTDALEETIDGKNTFHCSQMVLWQRGPKNERSEEDYPKIGRARALTPEKLAPLHKLDCARLPKERPCPVFSVDFEPNPESWLEKTGEQRESRLKDITWLLARKYDTEQIIPGWAAFNEKISLSDPLVTTPGMRPILQAPADDNSTVATVINRFVSITSKLGQCYTVIAMDQPLYSRAKELIWANQERYKDVILDMGIFTSFLIFLKLLDNIWRALAWLTYGLSQEHLQKEVLVP